MRAGEVTNNMFSAYCMYKVANQTNPKNFYGARHPGLAGGRHGLMGGAPPLATGHWPPRLEHACSVLNKTSTCVPWDGIAGWYGNDYTSREKDRLAYFKQGSPYTTLCNSPALYLDSFLQASGCRQ